MLVEIYGLIIIWSIIILFHSINTVYNLNINKNNQSYKINSIIQYILGNNNE